MHPGRGQTTMKQGWRLLRYAVPYRRGWVLLAGVTLFNDLFALLQPWPMKILVDHVLGHEPMPAALARATALLPGAGTPGGLAAWIAVAGLGIFAAHSAMDVALSIGWIRVGQRMVYDLAGDLFARLQRQSLLFHSRNAVGDSISRIADDSWAVHTIVETLLFAPLYALITLAILLVVMARMDLGLTLLALAVAPFMAGSSFLLGRPIGLASRAQREIESRIEAHVQQILSTIPVVQAFTQEEREHRRFQEFARTAIRMQQRRALVGSLSGLTSGLLSTLGTAGILWIGAQHVLAGRLSVGSVLVFLAYLGALYSPLETLMYTPSTLQGAAGSLQRVLEVLHAQRDVVDQPGAHPLPPVRGHLRLDHVTAGYETEQPVLHDLSLEVPAGQTLAIVGPSGAGKSTLASLLPRFLDPWSGSVSVDGYDLRTVQLQSLRAQVALVLQDPLLLPLTIAENIAYGRPEATPAEIEAAARAANAHDFIARLPEGYATPVGERGATLSGGERQRLAIARALLKDAPILILDEPTSALDAETEGLVLEALERLMAGRTTVLIAHRLSTVRRAERIVVLRAGRVVEQGTQAELLAQDGLFAQLYRLQFGAGEET